MNVAQNKVMLKELFRSSGTVVEHSHYYTKVEGSSLAAAYEKSCEREK
jgi:hypothetical protein